MNSIMIALGLLAGVQGKPADPVPDDIVVVAAKQKCAVRFADHEMTDAEFDRRAAEWAAGKPVRISARASTDLHCLTKIAFTLGDRGVRRIEFIDPSGKPFEPLSPSQRSTVMPQIIDRRALDPGLTVKALRDPALLGRAHDNISARASDMILAGDCAGARKFALQAGDLDAAAAIVTICGRTPAAR